MRWSISSRSSSRLEFASGGRPALQDHMGKGNAGVKQSKAEKAAKVIADLKAKIEFQEPVITVAVVLVRRERAALPKHRNWKKLSHTLHVWRSSLHARFDMMWHLATGRCPARARSSVTRASA